MAIEIGEMDIWIVAAAAGAGYIAQHWKDRRRSGQNISEPSPESSSSVKDDSSQRPLDKKCPLRRLTRREKLRADDSEENEGVSQEVPAAEVASTSELDGEEPVMLGNIDGDNVLSTSSLLPGFIVSHEFEDDQEGVGISDGIGEIGSSYGFARNRSNLRSRRINGRSIRPLSSLESCLMAQLYKENVEMEEFMLSSFPSPNSMQTVRPFLVTDGSKIINRASSDSFVLQTRTGDSKLHKETYMKGCEIVSGVPPLPNIRSLELRRKTKAKTGRELVRRLSSSSKMAGTKPSNSLRGSHGTLLFCLGISFGILSSFLANRREVDKLNGLLKQTENLVQDLQEELEMKDSLTVKELAVEDFESLDDAHEDSFNNKGPNAFSREINLDGPTKDDNKEFHYPQTENESLSKIEAELEAELEMLELNMNSSTLEGKLSNIVEFDPDFVPDIVHGELRADMFGRQASEQPYADRDGSGSSTTHSANYAVSPRELSLRLHEVLQSRLEEHVKELEAALENSQRKVRYTEAEHPKPWRVFSSSEAGGSSSIQGSPIGKEQNLADEPVVLNLAGEALDAYNEAYDEFAKINDSEEEDSPSSDRVDQDLYWIQNGREPHYTPLHPITNGTSLYRREEERNILQDETSRDENEHVDDEMEKLLIKHIVEKARKGSPVVLNAQRELFSVDENAL